MKVKRTIKLGVAVMAVGFAIVSCKKNKCAECHYDGPNGEVEIGTKCGDELEKAEADGYSDGTTTYTVHCGEH